MSIPTLYLDCLILASSAYPSGFSYSLFTLRRRAPPDVSTAFLSVLVLPYLVLALGVWAVRPGILTFRGATVPLLLLAALAAPLALIIEYGIGALALYLVSGKVPFGITVQPFWQRRLSIQDHLLLLLVAVGEEILYRVIWFGVLHHSFGLRVGLALGISSAAYGLNHLAFGATSVASKTVTGAVYGCLYLLGDESVWLPIVAHVLQNIALFTLAKESHA